ncbi:MAG: hypothetical protein IT506_11070 [Aquabacterium sp.]|nr:hypothetical protein [Aquabacterium sp.]
MPNKFNVHLYLVDNKFLSDAFFSPESLISNQNAYKEMPIDLGLLDGDLSALDICEEVFDLTNNPGRQRERLLAYGRERSVSVGDLVGVNGVFYLCKPIGWEAVTTPAWLEQTQDAQPDAPAM